MKQITKSEATAVARLVKSAAHLPGTEDLRIHDACDDSGLVFPAHITCDPETMRSVEKIAAAIQMHATRVPAKRGRPASAPDHEPPTKPRSIRLDDERWAKLQALGREWLERQIDSATIPD